MVDTIRFTEVNHSRDHGPRPPIEMPWGDYVAAAFRMERSGRVYRVKDGLATIPATFKAGERITKTNVATVTMLGLDIDGDPGKGQKWMAPSQVHDLVPRKALGYSTFSSTQARRKYRLLFPLAEEISVSDFERLWAYVHQLTGGTLMDPACKNPDRLYFDPRWPEGCDDRWVREFEGQRLSMEFVPADFVEPQLRRGAEASKPIRTPRTMPASTERAALRVLAQMIKHPFVRWCFEHPDDVRREPWRGLASNLIAGCDGHAALIERARDAFHEISERAMSYSVGECDKEFRAAADSLRSHGPMTFARMIDFGVPEALCEGGTSLVHAARTRARH